MEYPYRARVMARRAILRMSREDRDWEVNHLMFADDIASVDALWEK